jgi:hypothetical protein
MNPLFSDGNPAGAVLAIKGSIQFTGASSGAFRIRLGANDEPLRGSPAVAQLFFGTGGPLTMAAIAARDVPIASLTLFSGEQSIELSVSSFANGLITGTIKNNRLGSKRLSVYVIAF